MKNSKGKTNMVVGASAGAILMALVIIRVFGMKTGITGALLMVLIVAVSLLFGWMIGMNQRIQRRNWHSYMRGYREGAAKHTIVIEHPMCRCKIAVDERTRNNIPDFQ